MKSSTILIAGSLLVLAFISVSVANEGRNSFAFSPRQRIANYAKQQQYMAKELALGKKFQADNLQEANWFTQELDHFDTQEQRTWKQRYWVNDTFFNPDLSGPIFVMIGGEGSLGSYSVTSWEIAVYAQQYNALVLGLEHRFYGQSKPLPNLSNDNLRYLSSEQALADAANFITAMKVKYNAQDSPVVTFGGSYPGSLAAWFRLKYPHVSVGSVASSAPVQAVLDFYQYLDVVDSSLTSIMGPACDKRISSASQQIQSLLTTPAGTQKVASMFNLCAPLRTQKDVATLMSDLMGNFMGTVQYDREGNPVTIRTLCDIMEKGSDSDALANYVAVNNLFLQQQNLKCLDANYSTQVNMASDTTQYPDGVGIRQWTYQTCAEFGYFQTTDSDHQPFGDLVPLSYYTDLCKDAFGFDFLPRINQTNIHYGGKNPKGATNILFVNGSLDPWHALSVTEDLSNSLKAILIQGTAHCADFFPAKPTDPPGLARAQSQAANLIGLWLEQSRV